MSKKRLERINGTAAKANGANQVTTTANAVATAVPTAAPEAQAPIATGKITPEAFVLRAIKALQALNKGAYAGKKGVHSVFSSFNDAFRAQFPELGKSGPIEVTKAMAAKGLIVTHPAFKGAMLYLPEEAPNYNPGEAKAKAALKLIFAQ